MEMMGKEFMWLMNVFIGPIFTGIIILIASIVLTRQFRRYDEMKEQLRASRHNELVTRIDTFCKRNDQWHAAHQAEFDRHRHKDDTGEVYVLKEIKGGGL